LVIGIGLFVEEVNEVGGEWHGAKLGARPLPQCHVVSDWSLVFLRKSAPALLSFSGKMARRFR
jgi:hypothetical protein